MAVINYVVYVFPASGKNISEIQEKLHPVLVEESSIVGNILRSSQLEYAGGDIAKSPTDFAKDFKDNFHLLISWISSDSGMKGIDFFDYRDGQKTTLEQSIGAKTIGIFSLLVSLGLDEYLQEILL